MFAEFKRRSLLDTAIVVRKRVSGEAPDPEKNMDNRNAIGLCDFRPSNDRQAGGERVHEISLKEMEYPFSEWYSTREWEKLRYVHFGSTFPMYVADLEACQAFL